MTHGDCLKMLWLALPQPQIAPPSACGGRAA